MTREELAQYDDARQAIFGTRLDRYRARENDLPSEAEDMYDPDVPTWLDYREMRDDWPHYPPPLPQPRVTLRDDTLPHQIRIGLDQDGHHLITVSCQCLVTPGGGYTPIEKRPKWESDEAQAVWRRHVEEAEAAS